MAKSDTEELLSPREYHELQWPEEAYRKKRRKILMSFPDITKDDVEWDDYTETVGEEDE